MKKIFITGNAGAGKSTLCKELAARLEINFFSLDKIVWQENWQKTNQIEKKEEINKLANQDAWIIDGVSSQLFDRAELIIFLDLPRRVCYWRAIRRNSKYLFSSRPDLPANCPEILILPYLIKVIWKFPKNFRPLLLAEKAKRDETTFVHIRSRHELDRYLSKLKA